MTNSQHSCEEGGRLLLWALGASSSLHSERALCSLLMAGTYVLLLAVPESDLLPLL